MYLAFVDVRMSDAVMEFQIEVKVTYRSKLVESSFSVCTLTDVVAAAAKPDNVPVTVRFVKVPFVAERLPLALMFPPVAK